MPIAEITSDNQPAFGHGSKTVGVTAVQLTATSRETPRGITVKADSTNAGKVYVGGAGVTARTADATNGFELTAGESKHLPVDNATKVYAIASETGQVVSWSE